LPQMRCRDVDLELENIVSSRARLIGNQTREVKNKSIRAVS
jgi:hypothetical protein